MIVGTEWVIDAAGCREGSLRDLAQLRSVFQRIICELNLQVIGEPAWHTFPPPGGVTGLALLTESHLTCHTYPEFSVATFNLYCCRARPMWPWDERLREMLGAQDVRVRVLERRAPANDEASFDLLAQANSGSKA
jgi:S-adenosylmethionine decarboxylase